MNEKGYKAYEPGLICRGKQYAENTDFEEQGGNICSAGMMHYCVNPFEVLNYYSLVRTDGKFSDFTSVTALEPPVTDDGKKFATKKIHVGAKLGLDGFVKVCVDFSVDKTINEMPKPEDIDVRDAAKIGSSGDAAQIGSSGDAAQIGSSGDDAQIGSSGYAAQIGSSGYAAQIGSSGDDAKIGSSGYAAKIGSSGKYAQIGSSGDDAQITIENANNVVACVGKRGRIKAPVGTWCTLAEYGGWNGEGYPCVCVKSFQIDGETYNADTWYTLEGGEIIEVE